MMETVFDWRLSKEVMNFKDEICVVCKCGRKMVEMGAFFYRFDCDFRISVDVKVFGWVGYLETFVKRWNASDNCQNGHKFCSVRCQIFLVSEYGAIVTV